MNKKQFIYYRESVIQSVIADTYTFGMFILVLDINFKMLGNNAITTIFVLFWWLIFAIDNARSRKYTFTDKEKLIKFIKEQDE